MPFIFNPNVGKNTEYIIIPQYYSESKFRQEYPDENIVSMMTSDYKEVIRRIKSSKKVISSSLHGIILAEAYGVPAVFFRGLGKAIDFKYKDYYHSTERYDFSIAENVYDALKMPLPPIPDLSKLQKGLIESFPYDLWDK